MTELITEPRKDPLGTMMLDYFHGRKNAFVEVESTTLDMSIMTGETMFRSYPEMDEMERLALQLCKGNILDVGAGAGSHALYLQKIHEEVDALDISPGSIQVMSKRKVKNVIHHDLFSFKKRKYGTILMLMNGLGICGTLDGFNLFLQSMDTLLAEEGQIIADSTDMSPLYEEAGIATSTVDGYYGETEFIMKYRDITSDPFNWLYIDLETLKSLVSFNGFQCDQLTTGTEGRYLARIYR